MQVPVGEKFVNGQQGFLQSDLQQEEAPRGSDDGCIIGVQSKYGIFGLRDVSDVYTEQEGTQDRTLWNSGGDRNGI